jgi:hypothetical protein
MSYFQDVNDQLGSKAFHTYLSWHEGKQTEVALNFLIYVNRSRLWADLSYDLVRPPPLTATTNQPCKANGRSVNS